MPGRADTERQGLRLLLLAPWWPSRAACCLGRLGRSRADHRIHLDSISAKRCDVTLSERNAYIRREASATISPTQNSPRNHHKSEPDHSVTERAWASELKGVRNRRCREFHFAPFNFRYRRIRLFVELSCLSVGAVSLSSSGTIRCASTLPSSTPHWSKESMFQITPCVKTLCS